jgi:hypothetical protein
MTGDETGKQFVYDAWGRLVVVKDSGGSTLATYRYDGLTLTKQTLSTCLTVPGGAGISLAVEGTQPRLFRSTLEGRSLP